VIKKSVKIKIKRRIRKKIKIRKKKIRIERISMLHLQIRMMILLILVHLSQDHDQLIGPRERRIEKKIRKIRNREGKRKSRTRSLICPIILNLTLRLRLIILLCQG
jgi:hypothetical protein